MFANLTTDQVYAIGMIAFMFIAWIVGIVAAAVHMSRKGGTK